MSNSSKTALSDLLPEKAKALLSGTGRDFIDRIGIDAVKKVTAEVLCGENLREQTEPLTRRRISQICGALVTMFANGWIEYEDFTSNISKMAAEEMAAKRKAKTDGWPARWTLGLTDKLADNVLRGDSGQLPKYIAAFEDAILESASRSDDDCGPLTMQLSLPVSGKSTGQLNWTEITRLTTALGCAALTIRGSDKSIYGKLFERLVLGSVLTVLGFKCIKRSEASAKSMIFWLSDNESEERECDATLVIRPGKVVRFDIGFIGKGNPEITKDKLSRFSRQVEISGKQSIAKTIVIVDRLPKGGSTQKSALGSGTEIVQMSNKFWPQELAAKLKKTDRAFDHPILTMNSGEIGAYLMNAIAYVNIEDFVGALEISSVLIEREEGAGSEVKATIDLAKEN